MWEAVSIIYRMRYQQANQERGTLESADGKGEKALLQQ